MRGPRRIFIEDVLGLHQEVVDLEGLVEDRRHSEPLGVAVGAGIAKGRDQDHP